MRNVLVILAAVSALAISACGSGADSSAHSHRGQVYHSGSETYVSTYDPTANMIVWYLLINQSTREGAAQTSTSTWSRTTTPPTSLTPVTGKSVEFDDKGEPEGEPENTPEGEQVVDTETTPEEAQAEVENTDQSEQDSSTSEDSSSDSGGGDSGGGDSGGGDSGGGDSGGGGGE